MNKEEIKRIVDAHTYIGDDIDYMDVEDAVIEATILQHKEDIERVCDWLSKNYICFNGTNFNNIMIDKLKEAMDK